MTVKQLREILGDEIADMTDKEVMELDRMFNIIADVAINFAKKKISSKYCK